MIVIIKDMTVLFFFQYFQQFYGLVLIFAEVFPIEIGFKITQLNKRWIPRCHTVAYDYILYATAAQNLFCSSMMWRGFASLSVSA